MIVIGPALFFFIIKKNQRKLSELTFKHKFSTLYENLRHEKLSCLAYILLLFYKRLIVTFSIIFLRHDFNMQMLLILNSSLLSIIYYIAYKPFDTPYLNRIEVFNESTFLLCIYICYLYTDILDDT